jgi:hypothetical protein
MFSSCSLQVPQVIIPYGVPNSTSILSRMVCPKFNSQGYKLTENVGCWGNTFISILQPCTNKRKCWILLPYCRNLLRMWENWILTFKCFLKTSEVFLCLITWNSVMSRVKPHGGAFTKQYIPKTGSSAVGHGNFGHVPHPWALPIIKHMVNVIVNLHIHRWSHRRGKVITPS